MIPMRSLCIVLRSTTPSRIKITGRPCSVLPNLGHRAFAELSPAESTTIVPTASRPPVKDRSSKVIACWTKLPITTKTIKSKELNSPSVERPEARIMTHNNTNIMPARRTISMSGDPPGGELYLLVLSIDRDVDVGRCFQFPLIGGLPDEFHGGGCGVESEEKLHVTLPVGGLCLRRGIHIHIFEKC